MKLIVFIILFISNFIVYSEPLKVGVLQFAPPFSSKSDTSNHYYGFVIDLMNIVCERLKEQCEYVPIPKDGELYGLEKGILDITFSPSPMSSSLPEGFICSLPYLESHGQFLTLKSNSINTTNDINFKKIGFFKINFQNSAILSGYDTTNTLVEFQDPEELINALIGKTIDVILINHQAARYILSTTASSSGTNLKLVGDKIPIGNGYGIIALKRNSELIDRINIIFLDMEKDGSYVKIYNEYFGTNPTYHIKNSTSSIMLKKWYLYMLSVLSSLPVEG